MVTDNDADLKSRIMIPSWGHESWSLRRLTAAHLLPVTRSTENTSCFFCWRMICARTCRQSTIASGLA